MPHMVSTEGPALAVGDINGDGRDDVFCSSKGQKAQYLFSSQGKFEQLFNLLSIPIEVMKMLTHSWIDVNNDKFPDLVIASGGNEYYGKDKHLLPRVYLNDGKGLFTKKQDAFENIYQTALMRGGP